MRRGVRLFFLLLAAAHMAAGLPSLIVHEHDQDGHEPDGRHGHGAAEHPEEPAALQILLHGHTHPESAPQHSHSIAPTIPVRHDLQSFQPPADPGLLSAAVVEPPTLARFEPARRVSPPGAGPPTRLHWLCTLLI